jgi:3-polyprenyl-4-hydroxybenzoate decarboxylase
MTSRTSIGKSVRRTFSACPIGITTVLTYIRFQDAHLEAAAITRRVYEMREKAPLFHNVKGMQGDLWRILGAPAGCRKGPEQHARLAVHFCLDKTATPKDIIEKV